MYHGFFTSENSVCRLRRAEFSGSYPRPARYDPFRLKVYFQARFLAAAHKAHNFQMVRVCEFFFSERRPRHDTAVLLDRDTLRVVPQLAQQRQHGSLRGNGAFFSVDFHPHLSFLFAAKSLRGMQNAPVYHFGKTGALNFD